MECGLLLAKEQKLSQIILESDALTAVTSVIAVETSGYLCHVYQGIHSLLASFSRKENTTRQLMCLHNM